jgi:sulfate transport system permease protein
MRSDEAELNGLMLGGAWIGARQPVEEAERATTDPRWARLLILAATVGFLGIFVILPLIAVFAEALRQGIFVYFAAITNSEARRAIRLTLLVASIAVPLNAVFGLAGAWAITRFRFHGKTLLNALIDLPFVVSPVISGMIYVLVFGAQGWFGGWLADHHLRIIFATPGIVLATTFVTFPVVAR